MLDLKERYIGNAITMMSLDLSEQQLDKLRNCLVVLFNDCDLVLKKELPSVDIASNEHILKHFLATKKISGCSDKTIQAYNYQIDKFLEYIKINIIDITTNHIRGYLANVGTHASKSYVDDIRHILNSFFSFCEDEEYISKNPCKKIAKIKKDVVIRKPYDDMEVECLRDVCKTDREIALVDFLLSTGCRRNEVRTVKISDINFKDRSVIIRGKGGKWRYVYFSARCELHLKTYLQNRKCESEYLFCREKAPYTCLTCGGLVSIIKRIGGRTDIDEVHLHKFRRTFATTLDNHNVALQDIKEMMGHSNVNTTLIYVGSNNRRIQNVYKENYV